MPFALARCLLVFAVCSPAVWSADPGPRETAPAPLTAEGRMKADIFYLAGEECEGRNTGSPGNAKAAEYIAASFKTSGLQPAGTDGYFQPFTFNYGASKLGTPTKMTLKSGDAGTALKYAAEFVPTGLSVSGKASGDIVFVGYGLSLTEPKYDDYAGVDVKGKLAVIFRRAPNWQTAEKPTNPFQTGDNADAVSLYAKAVLAEKKGAAAVLFVNDRTLSKASDDLIDFKRDAFGSAVKIPVVHLKRSVVETMMADHGTTLAEIEEGLNDQLAPQSFALKGRSAELEVTIAKPEFKARNVVGTLPGSGPLADEVVVIGAHYDHVGRNEYSNSMGGPATKGKLHYGADDNASGTTGLLELARRFGAMPNRQGRRLVFIAFTGEELGLFGSKYYCSAPTFPLETTAFMLNMDMIGRAKEVEDDTDGKKLKDRIVVYGHGTGEGLEKLVDAGNAKFGFKMFKVAGGIGPSDHESFYKKKVPVLHFFTGTHKDYHQPSDTPDKINLPAMKKVTDMVEMFAMHFSTTLDRPKYAVVRGGSEDPTSTPRARGGLPKLGFTPGNYGEEDKGVLIEDIAEGRAAEAAGMKAGDFIIEIAGKPVKNMEGYMAALASQKAGVEIEVVVLRKDVKMTLKVTPR